ncbi:venom peptide MmKTx1 [Parasteatoda tepidariorum]|uniref:venom peptide MmKTx1 n=1 Tax=Parasteatoda tepidariorum TaxID=114398 RepID=UPI001C72794B|nr:venom peptide MmKTx1 [Parasteatoda tepidariorum]
MLRCTALLVFVGLALVLVAAEEETCEYAGKTYKKGESFPLEREDGCGISTCVGNGARAGKGCGTFQLRPESKCRKVRGNGKYPDCCERAVCPGDPDY